MLCCWEGNHWSDISLAMLHRLTGLLSSGVSGLGNGDEQPAYAPMCMVPLPYLEIFS